VRDEQIDSLLEHGPDMPATLAARIGEQIRHDTGPVKPLMRGGVYVLLFVAIFAAIAILFAAIFGFKGLHLLSSAAALSILVTLVVVALAGGITAARSMTPGSGSLHSWLLAGVAFGAYEVLVLTLFRDYSTTLFVSRGVICLLLGLACAAFMALPMWLIVRHGFVVEPVPAGAVIGLVSGLAGLTGLTLHCPVITTPHAGVWHAAVILVSVGAGMLAGGAGAKAKRRL
jgi:hypothetical protein